MDLALFDFDGSISTQDSFVQFLQDAVGRVRFFRCMAQLLPRVIAYKCQLYPNYRLKEDVLQRLFAGCSMEQFQQHVRDYDRRKLPGIIRPKAMEKIAWHRERGDEIIVVSASLELVLSPWCRRNNLSLLATQMEVRDNCLTGRLKGRNCWGAEKVRRIKSFCPMDIVDEIYAYGDSSGDKAMLAIAAHPFYRPFHRVWSPARCLPFR